MSLPDGWIAAVAVLAVVLGLWLLLAGRGVRRRRGLGFGRTLALDDVNLYSARYGLAGRPDRIVQHRQGIIPEEWKSAKTLRPWHRAQMGVYFILLEERTGARPPFGNVVCGDGTRYRVENTEQLRDWVVDVADQIRAARKRVRDQISVSPKPGQCRPCGHRSQCRQART